MKTVKIISLSTREKKNSDTKPERNTALLEVKKINKKKYFCIH